MEEVMHRLPWHAKPSGDGALGPRQAGRLAAVLFIASGVLTALSPFLPAPPDLQRDRVLGVGAVALALGLVALVLPWHRWGRWASALLIPVAHGLIALHNYWGGADPYRYGLLFMVSFIWIGLAQRRWTSVLLTPSVAAAYLVPLLVTDRPAWAVASAIYAIPVFVIAGEATAWVASLLGAARADLRINEERFRTLVRDSADGIAVVDFDGLIRYASPAVEKLLGHPVDDIIETLGFGYVHEDDVARAEELLLQVCETPGTCESMELRVRHRDSSTRWVQATVTNLFDSPAVAGLLVNFRDITDRKRLEDRLAYQAHHDHLTGLANRRILRDRVEHALARSARSLQPVSVLFIDLDGFKAVNDTLGHDAGDRLLCGFAERIGAVIRPADTLARLGGDEFGVLLEDANEEHAAMVARRVLDVLADPFLLVESAVHVTASIGIVIASDDAPTVDQLLRDADYAMYAAKSEGGGRALVYEGPAPALART